MECPTGQRTPATQSTSSVNAAFMKKSRLELNLKTLPATYIKSKESIDKTLKNVAVATYIKSNNRVKNHLIKNDSVFL